MQASIRRMVRENFMTYGSTQLLTTAGISNVLQEIEANVIGVVRLMDDDTSVLLTGVNGNTDTIGTGDSSTVAFGPFAIPEVPVVEFSLTVTAGAVSGTDDGAGNITGSGIASGSIVYATGVVSVTFDTAPGGSVLVTAASNGGHTVAFGHPLAPGSPGATT